MNVARPRFVILLTAALAALAFTAAPGAPATPTPLIGHFDSVSVSSQQVVLHGWAADTRRPHTSIAVRYSVTDAATNAAVQNGAAIAHDPRPDAGAVYPAIGPQHGFNAVVYLAAERDRICVWAVDPTARADQPLGCLTVVVPADRPATGHLDSVTVAPNAHIAVTGWTFDPDTVGTRTSVIVLLGGRTIPPAFSAVSIPAGTARPDVAIVYPGAGPLHGFHTSLPARPGTYPVCVLATDTYLYGATTLLGCRTVTV
jgi:hypothetical protein